MVCVKGKKILSLFLVIGMLISLLPTAAFAADEAAEKISTQAQLQGMGGGSYVLTDDIILDAEWNPSQWGDLGFTGTLDGNGYTITLAGQPLFSKLSGGTIRNLRLDGVVTGTGSLAGTMQGGAVENCWSGAAVTGGGFDDIAGLVGTLTAGAIQNCLITGELTADSWSSAYGIAGGGSGTLCSVTNCYYVNGSKGVAFGSSHEATEITADNAGYQTALDGLNQNAGGEGLLCWAQDTDGIPKPTRGAAGGGGGEPTVPPPSEVDKGALHVAITEAEKITEQGNYTDDSWKAFQSALETAKTVAAKAGVTQEEVSNAADALTRAQNELKPNPVTGEDAETARAALDAALARVPDSQAAEGGTKYYTADTWNAVQEQVKAANAALENDQATAESLNGAARALETAIAALKTEAIPQPVTPPDGAGWQVISTAEQLEAALASGTGYYRLANDIEGVFGAGMQAVTFSGVLDGGGHIITLHYGDTSGERSYRLVDNIGADGVIQNLGLAGKCQSEPFANKLSGKLINCFSWAESVSGNGGMVGTMNSGSMIVNCYTSTIVQNGEDGGGITSYDNENSYIIYSYWQGGKNNSPFDPFWAGSVSLIESSHKTETEMKQAEFIALLNSHRGAAGSEWALSDTSYPWQGEAAEDSRFAYPVVLKDLVSGKTTTSAGPNYPLETDVFGLPNGNIAQLSLEGYEGSVRWEEVRADHSVVISVGNDGTIFAGMPGSITVHAYGDGSLLASVQLNVTVPEQYTLKLYVDGEDFTDSTYTFSGSESKRIVPYVIYDTEEPVQVYGSLFNWDSTNTSVFSMMSTGDIWVRGTGTADATASLGGISAKITVKTDYVAATSITCNYDGTYYIHRRSPNSIGQNGTPGIASFIPLNNGDVATSEKIATVQPETASYTDYNVSVSNDSVLLPGIALVNALIPLKAGEADVTVTTKDPKLTTQYSDTGKVNLEYRNPLTSLTAESNELTVAAGDVIDAGLIFTGPYSSANNKPVDITVGATETYEGLHVSESYMTWEQSSPDGGRVSVYRSYPIYMPGDEGYHLYEGSVSMDQWLIEGVSEGTVTLVGTPVDVTYTGDPITLTVTVTKGSAQPDLSAREWTGQALEATGAYLYRTIGTPSFGAEWGIFGLARAGYNVSEEFFETYYASVVEEVKKQAAEPAPWDNTVTDTQRVSLALTAIGKDPTDVDGVNLLDYSWNKETHMPGTGALGDRQGSNELIYALLAIDAHDSFTQPESVSMTTEQMIDKLLSTYQLKDGGFGLTDNQSTSVDITAMALQALAKHRDRADVQAAIDGALERLAGMQSTRGDFGSSESTAQVIVALTELGIDPDENDIFQYSLIDGLKLYEQEDGSFSHSQTGGGNGMATEQAYYALAALHRFYQNNAFTLYNMNDMTFGADGGTAVTNVALRPESGSIRVGGTLQLTATVVPYTAANKAVTWSSSNPSVAAVDENGLVTGVAAGIAAVTVTTVDGSKTAAATITVTDNSGGNLPGGNNTITVTMSIDKLTINKGYVLQETEVEAETGATVWSVFQQAMDRYGIDYEYEFSQQYNSVYIQSIDGDGEFDHGPGSGWMYSVNGTYPQVGAGLYVLKDGDKIQWRYTTNLGADLDDGSNGASGGSANAGIGNLPEDERTVALTPKAAIDGQGEAIARVDAETVRQALEQASGGSGISSLTVTPEITGSASKVTVELPKAAVSAIADDSNLDLTVSTPIAGITITNEGLAELAAQSGATAAISAGLVAVTGADGKTASAVQVDVSVDGRSVKTVAGGIAVTIPGGERDTGNVLALVHDGGTETIIRKSIVREGGSHAAILPGPATVRIVDNSKEFDDVADTFWASGAIDFTAARELFSGTGGTAFSPDAPMTRGMLVTVLYRLEDAAAEGAGSFTDVADGAWYENAVTWASSNKIVNGVGNGLFEPDQSITRQDLAVMLYRYAGFLGMDTAASGDLSRFCDQGQVASYAREAMEWAVDSGLISGRTGPTLAPTGTATRAEAAAILQRLIINMAG